MAGGTGLYINSVVNDVTFGEIDTDYELREKLQKTAEEKGSEYLLEMLADLIRSRLKDCTLITSDVLFVR